jgi:hypothetical protein
MVALFQGWDIANLRIVMSSIMRRRNGLMGMLLSWMKVANPSSSRQDVSSRCPVGHRSCRNELPRERFSPLALFRRPTMAAFRSLSG